MWIHPGASDTLWLSFHHFQGSFLSRKAPKVQGSWLDKNESNSWAIHTGPVETGRKHPQEAAHKNWKTILRREPTLSLCWRSLRCFLSGCPDPYDVFPFSYSLKRPNKGNHPQKTTSSCLPQVANGSSFVPVGLDLFDPWTMKLGPRCFEFTCRGSLCQNPKHDTFSGPKRKW